MSETRLQTTDIYAPPEIDTRTGLPVSNNSDERSRADRNRSRLTAFGAVIIAAAVIAPAGPKAVGLLSAKYHGTVPAVSGPRRADGGNFDFGPRRRTHQLDPLSKYGNTIIQGAAADYFQGVPVELLATQNDGAPYHGCIALNLGGGTKFFVTPDGWAGIDHDKKYPTRLPSGEVTFRAATCIDNTTIVTSHYGRPQSIEAIFGSPENIFKIIVPSLSHTNNTY